MKRIEEGLREGELNLIFVRRIAILIILTSTLKVMIVSDSKMT